MDILKGYLFGIGYAFLCLLLSLFIYKCGVPKKITRKVVHILVGFEWIILYHYFGAGLHFLSVCVFFLIVLAVAYRKKLMPMISSDNDNAPGTVYYAVAMTGVAAVACFVPDVMIPFGIGIFCTSVGDGVAGLVGQYAKRFNPRIYKNKTALGSIANLAVSALSAFVMNACFDIGFQPWHYIVIGAASAGLELITGFGLDNISITWGITLLGYLMINYSEMVNYVLPIALTPFIICFAVEKKALTRGGILAAVILDVVVSLAFGNAGFVLLCFFLFGGVLTDKIKTCIINRGRKDDFCKKECRNYMQVLANGFVAGVCACGYIISHNRIFLFGFIASLSEALADTTASGIGVCAKSAFDPFRMKKCDTGASGGMSWQGTFASFVGSYSLSTVAFGFGLIDLRETLIVAVIGFLGAVFDSFLGSVLQVKCKCSVCEKITERSIHCDKPCVRFSGIALIDNDCVNLLSTLFACMLAIGACMTIC